MYPINNNNDVYENVVINPASFSSSSPTSSSSSNEFILLVKKKINFFENIIQKTLLHVHNNKMFDMLTLSEANACINSLYVLNKKIADINLELNNNSPHDDVINHLQLINNELSSLFKLYGTSSFEDLLWICFGNNYNDSCDCSQSKIGLLKKYFHPISYKVVNEQTKSLQKEDKKSNSKNLSSHFSTKEDYQLTDKSTNFDCFDAVTTSDKFCLKVHGMKIIVINTIQNKTVIITGVVDDVIVDFLSDKYIVDQIAQINSHKPDAENFDNDNFKRFVLTMTLKDHLINDTVKMHSKYVGVQNNLAESRNKSINIIVKEFMSSDMFMKRNTISQLLINTANYEHQYLAYLLYDLLSNDVNGAIDTQEQTMIFDSFSWTTKLHFRDAIKKTIKYTNSLSNVDINKIPLEQQICLLKVSDSTKEKAMQKIKEIKAKSEDSCSKARQYIDGLLKIPFNIYKKEPILFVMKQIHEKFKELLKDYGHVIEQFIAVPLKDKYTSIELIKYLKYIKTHVPDESIINGEVIRAKLQKKNKTDIVAIVAQINNFIIECKIDCAKLCVDKKDKSTVLSDIIHFITSSSVAYKSRIELFVLKHLCENKKQTQLLLRDAFEIDSKFAQIGDYMTNVRNIMDKSIHGHDKAKKQIERIICQWINGEQDGHCFGFEGPPGVGKTSLAKYGLSNCLVDEHGVSRPFAMIQIGGDSNGSSLHGHNYTYVGSNWGSIVQILIDKKCMNPIIFIDEIDKISKTEQGREIVGILTHLLDTTQNDCFQDKYFNGIDLDLSKALFILSYNDVKSIDKVLLDRIHRIQFSNLSVEDKLVVCEKHILPEIYKKMGLENAIFIDENTMRFIIEEYTCEPGVRKLKEILFEIIGEINNNVFKSLKTTVSTAAVVAAAAVDQIDQIVQVDQIDQNFDIPIILTIDQIKLYLKDRHQIKHKRIRDKNLVGTINGLWANSVGQGGVIPIQTSFVPSSKFLDLKLTGMQGDVMKESMNVALTLAWSLTAAEPQLALKDTHGSNKNVCGVHVHAPDGATPKDGPSAGTAITCAIYSLLNNKPIKGRVAITGEISLDGCVTEIGGLDLKILGGIKAGVKEFLFPLDNAKDHSTFMEKYANNQMMNGIVFHKVSHINEVFEIIFE